MVKILKIQNVYKIELEAGESIEIKINSNSVFSKTVGTNKVALSHFSIDENEVEV